MSDHPYLPGTVWAPKRGRSPARAVVQCPEGWKGLEAYSDTIWYEEVKGHGRTVQTHPKAFKRWAGEQVKS